MVERAEFDGYVQEALDHLYDHAHLQVHPLATLLPRGGTEAPGHALHRALVEAIELLKPSPSAPYHLPAWRTYRYLSLRYVEALTIGRAAQELGISSRQCRRDHREALGAISAVLWDRWQRLRAAPAEPARGGAAPVAGCGHLADEILDVEVDRLGAATTATVTNLDRTVEGAVVTVGALAADKGVQVVTDLPADLPLVVADRTVLRQALLELLLYAVDWGVGGQVALAARAEADSVVLDVLARRPDGERRLAPGLEAAPDDSRVALGRKLLEMQGGQLALTVEARGLAISVALPRSEPQAILVVDDNVDLVHLFQHYLSGSYRVIEAMSGAEAIRLARELRPSVITLDVMMPGQDGWEVLQTLKNDSATSGVPIVVCSVLRERELALSLGAADFLAKPVTRPQLLAALQRCRSER